MWNIRLAQAVAGALLLLPQSFSFAEEEEKSVADLARERGFEVVDESNSLLDSMRPVLNGKAPLDGLTKRLIRLRPDDIDRGQLKVAQAANQNEVLLHWGSTPLFLINYKRNGGTGTLIEGGDLNGMEFEYVAIRGTKNYTAVLGSEHQALVIEPINLTPQAKVPTNAEITAELRRLKQVYSSKDCVDFFADRACVETLLDDDLHSFVAQGIDSLLGRLHDKIVPLDVRRIRGLKFLAAPAPVSAACGAQMKTKAQAECLMAALVTDSPLMKRVISRRLQEIVEYKDDEGFQDVNWGATFAEVKRLVKGVRGTEADAQAQLKVGGRPATVRFRFAMKKLVEVEALILRNGHDRDGDVFRQLDVLLKEKYGDGTPQAAGIGEQTEWITEHSVIVHQLARGFPSRHTVVYRSVKLAPILANLAKEQL